MDCQNDNLRFSISKKANGLATDKFEVYKELGAWKLNGVCALQNFKMVLTNEGHFKISCKFRFLEKDYNKGSQAQS